MKKHYLLFLIIIVAGCDTMSVFRDDCLTAAKEDYFGNEIRLDGYYYQIVNTFEGDYGQAYFLYRNGVILDGGGFLLSKQEDFEEEIVNGVFNTKYNLSKLNWGVYNIANDKISFQKWYSSSGGGLPVYTRVGTILNDTSFHISISYRLSDTDTIEYNEKNETYMYKYLSIKPDSTNTFIE